MMNSDLIKELKNDVESIRKKIHDLPTRDYLQTKLSAVYWELDRLERVSQSRELSVLAADNGGHISDRGYTENGHYDRD